MATVRNERYDVAILESVEAIPEREWNEVVERSALSCLFHRHEWLRAIEHGTDHVPRHLVAHKDTNLVGLFPNFVTGIDGTPFRRLASLTLGCGGPLVTTDEDEIIRTFLEVIPTIEGRTTVSHVISAADQGYVRYGNTLQKAGYTPSVETCRVLVDLTRDWDDVLAGMDRGRRRGIRKGHERDVTVSHEPVTRDRLDSFYDEYRAVIDRLGATPLPRTFVTALAELDDRILLLSLDIDGTDAGSYLYLIDAERSALHHYLSGVRQSHFEYNASELLHEHAMKWGVENAIECYDLGAVRSDFRHGLFGFKESFGGDTVPLLSWERGLSRPEWWLFDAARRVHQRFGIGGGGR